MHTATTGSPLSLFDSSFRALAVFAHPDDAELSCFGTLAAVTACGGSTAVLVLSAGESSAAGNNDMRLNHASEASRVIGANLRRHSFPDGYLVTDLELIRSIEQVLNEYRPNIVITHSTEQGHQHQDHIAVGLAASIASSRIAAVSMVLHAEPPASARNFRPNVFVDISDFMETKLQAIAIHKTEHGKPYLTEEAVRLRGNWWTTHVHPRLVSRSTYFEAFRLGTLVVGSHDEGA